MPSASYEDLIRNLPDPRRDEKPPERVLTRAEIDAIRAEKQGRGRRSWSNPAEEMAARVLKGRTVAIETFLVPATAEVARGLSSETVGGKTLVDVFADAGCEPVPPPSCAACLGGPPDTYGRASGNEVVISTTNRNFIGRMGSKSAQIYLASPLTVAASAVTGHITDPREMLGL